MHLHNKKILLGICGSIAAYKTALLTRLLIKQGAQVKVIMTKAATEFISPLTLSTLSKNPVITQFYTQQEQLWHNHVELGLWADVFIVAPASGNTLAKMANGICDNILLATYLSARCPVFFAPAMDLDMWLHPATQNNVAALKKAGNQLIPVGDGELASGLVGKGRLAEPDAIVQHIEQFFTPKNQTKQHLKGKKILITAGPTYEPIDPVRFVGNRSSGKMGIALAEAAYAQGAEVCLVLGPSHYRPHSSAITVLPVETAEQMYIAAVAQFDTSDIAILSAAVSDYTPKETSSIKIKKKTNNLQLTFTKTKDILAHLGKVKTAQQLLVGFALETNNEIENAQSKLKRKNLDFIVLNSLQDKGAGFKHDTNKITILDKNGSIEKFALKTKTAVAHDIVQKIIEKLPVSS